MKYAVIAEECEAYPLAVSFHALGVSRSGYYAWLKRLPSAHAKADEVISVLVSESFEESRGTYGARRIKKDLAAADQTVSRARITRLMNEQDLESKHKRKLVITTKADPNHAIAPNLLDRAFEVDQPDTTYVGDITYVWTQEGWLYLAVMIDLFSRLVVGWSVSNRMKAGLAVDAMQMAIDRRRPKPGLMAHSDRGSQYTGSEYQSLLNDHEMICSMSRRGNCWDNSVAESFFKSLKQELVYHERFETRAEAELCIFSYIEEFYNRKRRHSNNNYLSPMDYERLAKNN